MFVRRNIPNTVTLLNALAGFFSIIAAADRKFIIAAALMLLGVLLDFLDGKLARIFARESQLGKQLDSLADMITFGVAPAVLVIMLSPSFVAYVAGGLFVFSAALRLGRFNVQKEKDAFFGVPTTVNGVLLPVMVFFHVHYGILSWYLLVMAVLMNAPIKITKLFR